MVALRKCVILTILFEFISFFPAVSQVPFLRLEYKEGASGTIYERHFVEYDILDTALGEAWLLVERKEYVKAHTVLAAAIVKLYKSPKTPRYIEEQAIEENYLGLLIVADSSLSLAQGKVREAFNKLYAGNTLVCYSRLYDPGFDIRIMSLSFSFFDPNRSLDDALRFCFIGARAWLLEGSLEVKKQEWLKLPLADFEWYFDTKGKCNNREGFERDLRWYLENTKDFVSYYTFVSRDDVPEAALFKKIVGEYTYLHTMKSDRYFAIDVLLDKDRAYQFIEQYYGLH